MNAACPYCGVAINVKRPQDAGIIHYCACGEFCLQDGRGNLVKPDDDGELISELEGAKDD